MSCSSAHDNNAVAQDSGVDASNGACKSCDDGFSCTIDTCNAGTCVHSMGPNSGATACSTGQYCTIEKGCVSAPACASNADCSEAWKGDACKANARCDAASSVCVFDALDKDGDKHIPYVCGGDDCNDANANIHPGATEVCNGDDDDCDGTVDEETETNAPMCSRTEECTSGKCTCKSENLCKGICTDILTDAQNCGVCSHSCFASTDSSVPRNDWACEGGSCVCGGAVCGTVCTNLLEDEANCGACGTACGEEEVCRSGACTLIHKCTTEGRINGTSCEGDQLCKIVINGGTFASFGVACATDMCDCPSSYTCGQVSDWEYECYSP